MRKFLAGVCLAACAGGAAASQQKLPVVASFSILADLVRQVGGDQVEVTSLIEPGANAHAFQASPRHARAVAGAALLVANGMGFDDWMQRLAAGAGDAARRVSVVSDGIVPLAAGGGEGGDLGQGHDHDHSHGHAHNHDHGHRHGTTDPHAWQDPRRVMVYVRNIERSLSAADPAHADRYQRRAAAYLDQLATLDAWIAAQLAQVPPERRKVVVGHDAFAYFAQRYGLTVVSVAPMAADSQPGAHHVAAVVTQLRASGVRALFTEQGGDPRLMQQIARESGGRVVGPLYSDSLSSATGEAPDYMSMMRANTGVMLRGLLP